MVLATQEVVIQLPPLHAGRLPNSKGQVELDECPARFIVCVCGRRWGKTSYGVRKCLKEALVKPGVYWWIGPNYPAIAASGAWPLLKRLVRPIPNTEIREADRYITLPNGSEIWIKSAEHPDSLRGPKLRGAVFDEMAQISPDAWNEAVRPSLSDYKGWALFIGTPKGKNWVYRLYQQAPFKSDWARFRKPTLDNPYIDPAEIEAARQDMSDNQFKQEYEADFGASQFLVFPEFDRDLHAWRGEVPKFKLLYGGLDFGGPQVNAHKSAGTVAGLTLSDELVFIKEFEQSGPAIGLRQLEWIFECQFEAKRASKFSGGPRTIMWKADKTQMWGIQLARSSGVTISSSHGGKDSIDQQIELIHRRLKVRRTLTGPKTRLYYLPSLHFIPEAFERYRNPDPRPEDEVQPRGPLAVNDDTMATIRYLVEGIDYGAIGDPAQLYKGILARVGT